MNTAMSHLHEGFTIQETSFCVRRVRELTTTNSGSLVKITGQVVRSHPIHPELVTGTLTCIECQTTIYLTWSSIQVHPGEVM